MLDREAVREFLDEELKETEVPDDIFKKALVESFCKYVEDDYYDWLKDNFKSFFNYGKPDWKRIRERIRKKQGDGSLFDNPRLPLAKQTFIGMMIMPGKQ